MINFHKMHSLGNDFMIVQDTEITKEEIIKLGNRHTGVGFDQLLMISTANAVPYVDIYNADGSKAGFCGNGFRCIVGMLLDFVPGKVQFETISGVISGELCPDGQATICFPKKTLIKQMDFKKVQNVFFVDLGNQHLVCLENELMPFEQLYTTCLQEYGEDINIFQVIKHNKTEATILCYERGVGITQACGSGACAVASVLMEKGAEESMMIKMPGGTVQMQKKQGFMWQTGPIVYVFAGVC